MEDKNNFLKDVSNWNNHRPLLFMALEETKTGNVLELGCGEGSTKYIFEYCKDNDRLHVFFENNRQYYDLYNHLYDCHVCIPCYVEDWNKTNIEKYEWAVALIDHAPGEDRHIRIKQLQDCCKILVIHDSEPAATGYELEKIWHLFKYRVDIRTDGAWASAVSNHIDITKWRGMELGGYKIS